MEVFYKQIEDKIAASGYPGSINGYDIYHDISDEIEDKENGTYLFMKAISESLTFTYQVDVMDEDFNLSFIDILDKDTVFHIDFDL